MTSANGAVPRTYRSLAAAMTAAYTEARVTSRTQFVLAYGRSWQVQRARAIKAGEGCVIDWVEWPATWRYRGRR